MLCKILLKSFYSVAFDTQIHGIQSTHKQYDVNLSHKHTCNEQSSKKRAKEIIQLNSEGIQNDLILPDMAALRQLCEDQAPAIYGFSGKKKN